MDYNYRKSSNLHYPYNMQQFEEGKFTHDSQVLREIQPINPSSGWGHTAIQFPTDNRYNSFTAENIPKPPAGIHEIKKEDDDFERSISMASEYNFTENNEKPAMMYPRTNYAVPNKMENEMRSPSVASNEEKEKSMYYAQPTNLFDQISTTVKPVSLNTDYTSKVVDICSKKIPVLMSGTERGEWNANLLFKIKSKSDSNASRKSLIFELTMEDDPQFLYTCELGENDYHEISRTQGIIIEFHKFPEVFFTSFLES